MICEFCKAYVTNLEVHNCFNSGNQHHRSYATIPQSSSANLAQNSDLRASQPMDYEAWWSSTDQFNSSKQQNIFPDMHQRTGYEEKAAAEMFSLYEFKNTNPYKPETSDFLLPGMHPIQENKLTSTYLQQPSEVSEVFINEYPQNYEPSNPKWPENTPMSAAKRTVSTGSQQTLGRRHPISNTTLPSASSGSCEKNSEDKILGIYSCVFKQNVDEPQKKNPFF
ncbi:hypothetical protein CDAR_175461 [Caerostris darwini]|uniref:Peptidase S7 domain-containing protein n=1 Tax=Caerostris darwini TaxID=1538125 RepID=A0AAV4VYZ5_9ARAC|nr:hypothetical protein CDAR_175461 [Caerostris darwini]